jgi:hypothetical protein
LYFLLQGNQRHLPSKHETSSLLDSCITYHNSTRV